MQAPGVAGVPVFSINIPDVSTEKTYKNQMLALGTMANRHILDACSADCCGVTAYG